MRTSAENNKRIALNTIFLYVRMFVIMIVTLYTTRVVLQVLGVVDYGIYNVVGGVVSMFSFLNASMANGFQRFLNVKMGQGNMEDVNDVFKSSLTIQIALIGIVVLLGETLGVWFLETQMNIPVDRQQAAYYVFQFTLLTFVFTMLQAPFTAVLIAFENMKFYAYLSIFEACFKLLIVYFLMLFSYDKLVLYSILVSFVACAVLLAYVLYCRRHFSFLSFRFSSNKDTITRISAFSGWNTFGSLAHLLEGQGVNILLNIYFGPVVNAARGIAFQVLSGLNSFVLNIHIAARPQVIKSYSVGDTDRMWYLTYQVSRFLFYLMLLLSLPLFMEIEFVLSLWLGSEGVTEYTVAFVRIIILTGLCNVFANPITTVVHATGKMKAFQIVCSSVIVCVIPISYVFLENGCTAETVMIISLILTILVHIVRLFMLKRILAFSILAYVRNVMFTSGKVLSSASLLSLFVYWIVGLHSSWMSCLLIAIYGGIVLLCIYMLGLSPNEKSLIIGKMKQLVCRLK